MESHNATREIPTVDQTTKLLQVSTRTILQLARGADLRGHKVGRESRFLHSDVIPYVQADSPERHDS